MKLIVTISDEDAALIRAYLVRQTGGPVDEPGLAEYLMGLFVGTIKKHAAGLRTIEAAKEKADQ